MENLIKKTSPCQKPSNYYKLKYNSVGYPI